MPRGGKRAGAGRKPKSATKKTRAVAKKAAAEGLTPIEVMLHAMRMHAKARRWDRAAAVAKDAAPYCHPRLAAVKVSGDADAPLVLQVIEYADAPARPDDDPHPQ